MNGLSFLGFLAAATVLVGCSEQRVVRDLTSQIQAADTAIVRLDAATSFPWDTVYLFAPYTPQSVVQTRVSNRVSNATARSLEMDEGHVLLVFVAQGHVVSTVQMPRNKGDLADVARDTALTPSQAVFRVARRDGWPYLQPAN